MHALLYLDILRMQALFYSSSHTPGINWQTATTSILQKCFNRTKMKRSYAPGS